MRGGEATKEELARGFRLKVIELDKEFAILSTAGFYKGATQGGRFFK